MITEINIKYIHPNLNLGFEDIRNVWLLSTTPIKLSTHIHQGNLVFRLPGSGKHISYKTLKRGLIKKQLVIRMPCQLLPF